MFDTATSDCRSEAIAAGEKSSETPGCLAALRNEFGGWRLEGLSP
jgi:hypothetical protein